MDGPQLKRCAVILAVIGVTVCSALPIASAAGEVRHFEVPAGEAASTLITFGLQADWFVKYDFDQIQHHRTTAVKGDFEAREALRILLKDSGLSYRMLGPRSAFFDTGESRNPDTSSTVMPPATKQNALALQRTMDTVYVRYSPDDDQDDRRGAVPTDTSAESISVNAKEIEHSGAKTATDILRPITFNFGGGATEDTLSFGREATSNPAFGSGVNLRGLGSRATLVLIDGHRIAPSGSLGTFFDISSIPLSVVHQVQVVSDGQSTLLGEDAIGGVVNFQLRGGAATPETRLVYGGVGKTSPGEHLFSQSISGKSDSASGLLAAEYYDRDALFAGDRRQATSDLTPWGGGNFGNPAGNPGTLVTTSANGAQQLFSIPAGQNGVGLKASQLTPGFNLHDLYQGATVLPHQQRLNLVGTGDLKISDEWTLWGDALLSRRRIKMDNAGLTAALSIPSTNPWYVNPVAGSLVQVLYGFGPDVGAQTVDGEVYSGQFTAGATYTITPRWAVTGYLSYAGEFQRDVLGGLVDFGALQPYLSSSDPHIAFNAFGAGTHTNPDTIAAIRTQRYAHYASGFTTLSASASGPVATLPTGDVALRFGADYRLQTFASQLSATDASRAMSFDANRHVKSFYAQSIFPLLSERPGNPHRLEFSMGLRNEIYSDVRNALAPQLGLRIAPSPNWSLQAGWAKLFRPPNLPDLSEANNLSAITVLPDSGSSKETTALVWTGGNRDLRPESARNFTANFTLAPAATAGFSLSTTYFHTVFDNIIESIDLPYTALTDPQYSWMVTRDVTAAQRQRICGAGQFVGSPADCLNAPVGALVDLRVHNVDTLKTDGVDIRARQLIPTPRGQVTLALDSTYLLRYAQAVSAFTPITSELNHAHYPMAFRAKATTAWESPRFWVQSTVNYQGRYEDTDSVPSRPVSPWTTWDMTAGYRLNTILPRDAGQMQIIASAFNVLNHQPPFLNNALENIGYDQENGDLLGRRLSLEMQIKW